jgi:hypothetical protein
MTESPEHSAYVHYGSIYFLVASGFGLCACAYACVRGWQSRRWPTAPGLVFFHIPGESAIVDRRAHLPGYIFYTYEVSGREFTGHRVAYGELPRAGMTAIHYAAWFARLIPTPGSAPVYYDPRHPQRAVLRAGLQPAAIIGTLLCAGVMLWLLTDFLAWRPAT